MENEVMTNHEELIETATEVVTTKPSFGTVAFVCAAAASIAGVVAYKVIKAKKRKEEAIEVKSEEVIEESDETTESE